MSFCAGTEQNMIDEKNSITAFPGSRNDLSGGNSVSAINNAIEKFRHNSCSVPSERLYTAYRGLKEIIDSLGPDFAALSSHFNDVFLRILEERGEVGNGIYRTVLRDSPEFRFLSNIFIKDEIPETVTVPEPVPDTEPDTPAVKLTLKSILADRKTALENYGADDWKMYVEEHFSDIADEKELVKSGAAVLGRINRRGDFRDFHIVCIVEYLFLRLRSFKQIDLSSKEYAMKLMNMVSSKGETWNRLHSEYLDIIKK